MHFTSQRRPFHLLLVVGCALTATSCQANPSDSASASAVKDVASGSSPVAATVQAASSVREQGVPVAAAALPQVLVHKSASCGCCGSWVEHLRNAGFAVQVKETEDLNPIKERLGVPYGKGSCHTAEVGGYVVEGHVPADDIKRLLRERPKGKGLVLPGMPLGSPGMEVPDGSVQAYTVELVQPDGHTRPFARHGG